MSSVISDKQEKEKKALAAEERKRRERRRLKELNGLNGVDTPEDEEEVELGADKAHQRNSKVPRSMSPATGNRALNGTHSLATQLSGRANSPSRFGPQAGSSARDSFLNYFFGKDGNQNAPNHSISGNFVERPNSRHVSTNIEPSFSGSIRRGDTKIHDRIIDSTQEQDLMDSDSLMPWESESPALTEREALETELIRRLISSYFNIVRESIADQVPKAIMHLLVNFSKDVIQNRLVSELYREALFEDLLYEDDGIKAERQKCEKLLQTYKEAAKIVGEVL